MRPDEHNLNSLRKLVRDLQEENKSLKKLLDENNIIYESESLFDDTSFSDEYDDDQGARIIPDFSDKENGTGVKLYVICYN